MTTFSYSIVLNDSEMITLEAALNQLIQQCELELKVNPRAPYYAWLTNAQSMQERLHSNRTQTSGHRIDPETGEYSIWIGASENVKRDAES